MTDSLPPATIITTDEALAARAQSWAAEPLIAIDTESNSLYAYRERVCLIQLSTREADFIIDPLAITDMSPLGPLLADPKLEKVFHAAEYDIMCLKRDYGFTFAGLFDTMLAARVCGDKLLGLANMLDIHFGVKADKKFQRANWGARPLSPDLLRYAQQDTHFLPQLRDIWRARLEDMNRWREAQEAFKELTALPPAEPHYDPEGFWRINGTQYLSPRQMSLVRELYQLRDRLAERRDVPPFKVFDDRTLILLAQMAPHRLEDLYSGAGLSSAQVRRYGDVIVQAIRRGESRRPPQPPRSRRPNQDVLLRYETLKAWRKQRARERGVESDVILSREAMWELARRVPKTLEELKHIPGLGEWKLQTYGEEILRVLKSGIEGDSE